MSLLFQILNSPVLDAICVIFNMGPDPEISNQKAWTAMAKEAAP